MWIEKTKKKYEEILSKEQKTIIKMYIKEYKEYINGQWVDNYTNRSIFYHRLCAMQEILTNICSPTIVDFINKKYNPVIALVQNKAININRIKEKVELTNDVLYKLRYAQCNSYRFYTSNWFH